MTPERYQQVRDVFGQALLKPARERDAYLTEACDTDSDLRREVETLLENSTDVPGEFLDSPVAAADTTLRVANSLHEQSLESLVGRQLGPYRLLRVVGTGGMGTVYEALKEDGGENVALKILNTGLTTAKALRRFRHETEILGRLDHEGIARIFAAGTFGEGPSGVPYFAMEFVSGAQPITHYADRIGLDHRQRMLLLAQVCDAVEYAHDSGVVHRDLKPGNVLVSAEGEPKVIDFGVARVTDQDVEPTTLRTDLGQLVGTLPYMSPEQVAGNSEEVDSRSDVYALGVIGYQLLSGELPCNVRDRSLPEAVQVIRDEDPTPLGTLNRQFRGDLDTIFTRTLEKDRKRRYVSAAAVAADLRRYLQGQPIVAQRPGKVEQFRKIVRRHKSLVTTAVLVMLGLLIGTGAAVWQALEATAERDRTRIQAVKAQTVTDFLLNILSQANSKAHGPEVTVRQVLDQAAGGIAEEFSDDPALEASIRVTIGDAYIGIGELNAAGPHLRGAWELSRDHGTVADFLQTSERLLVNLELRGDAEQAREVLAATLPMARATKADNTLSLVHLLQRQAIIESEDCQTEPAVQAYREAFELMQTLESECLSNAFQDQCLYPGMLICYGQPGEAVASQKELNEFGRRVFGPDSFELAWGEIYLASIYQQMGQTEHYAEALTLLEKAITTLERVQGEDSHDVAVALGYQAEILESLGHIEAAERGFRKALRLHQQRFGTSHFEIGAAHRRLGRFLGRQGKVEEGRRHLEQALASRRENYPEDHYRVQDVLRDLAELDACADDNP